MKRDQVKQEIEGVLLKNHTYLSYGMLMHSSEIEGAKTIAEEIMKLVDQLVSELREEYQEIHQINVKTSIKN